MRTLWFGLLVAGMAVLLWAPAAIAQQAVPNLSGVWDGPIGGGGGGGLTGLPGIGRRRWREALPPLRPWAQEILRANRQGVDDPNEQGLDTLDPNNNCIPPGMPRIYAIARPFEIVQSPGKVHVLYEWDHTVRRIFTDGRSHPEGYYPTFMGWSIGHWEQDTLVVDTVGVNELTWLDGLGTPHSDELRVIERFRKTAPDILEIRFRFEDPKAFTEPWEGSKTYELKPDWQILEHINCEDHLREDHMPEHLKNLKDQLRRVN